MMVIATDGNGNYWAMADGLAAKRSIPGNDATALINAGAGVQVKLSTTLLDSVPSMK